MRKITQVLNGGGPASRRARMEVLPRRAPLPRCRARAGRAGSRRRALSVSRAKGRHHRGPGSRGTAGWTPPRGVRCQPRARSSCSRHAPLGEDFKPSATTTSLRRPGRPSNRRRPAYHWPGHALARFDWPLCLSAPLLRSLLPPFCR